jgi:hypothetical protein
MLKEIQQNMVRAYQKFRLKDITDEYTTWLSYANAGMQSRGNLYCFDYAIRNLPSSAPILEIGSFCGLSTNMITYYKEKHAAKNRLITCDKWEFDGVDRNAKVGNSSMITYAEIQEFVKRNYIQNIKMFSRYDIPFSIEMFSKEFFDAWRKRQEVNDVLGRKINLGGTISFAYIDGNHTYKFAKEDFLNCDEFLEPGGFILFDDSADLSGWGVCTLMKEVKQSPRYELVIKNPNYLFKKIQ